MPITSTKITRQTLFEIRLAQACSRRFVVACLCFAITLYLVEQLSGFVADPNDLILDLALPPSETVDYKARDFQFIVSTNRLGFRGPEFPLRRSPEIKRILVLGNSFTYGWGVDFEQTWPRLLEKELGIRGKKVETANLATPGTTTRQMTYIASRSIPILKPDLVIISVLQGGALFTFGDGLIPEQNQERPVNFKSTAIAKLRYIFPNYVSLLQSAWHRAVGVKERSSADIHRTWKSEAALFLTQMTSEQLQRYHALDSATVERFINGELNVSAVRASIANPDLFVETVKSKNTISNGRRGMHDMFSKIKSVAEANGAHVVVASMPYGAYLGGGAAENISKLGFNIPAFLSRDQTTEDQIRIAANDAQLKFIYVLDDFHYADSDSFFIPFDGHYNSSGTEFYAQALSKKLLSLWPDLFE